MNLNYYYVKTNVFKINSDTKYLLLMLNFSKIIYLSIVTFYLHYNLIINNFIIILLSLIVKRNGNDFWDTLLGHGICITTVLSYGVQLVNTRVQLYIDGVIATVDWGQANWTHCQPHCWFAPLPRGELIIVIFLFSTVVNNTLIGSVPSNMIRRDDAYRP